MGRKGADQGKFQTNEDTVYFQLPEQAFCHNADKQELANGAVNSLPNMFKLQFSILSPYFEHF